MRDGRAGSWKLYALRLETGWRSQAVFGNAGVVACAVLPAHGIWRTASRAAVRAGFRSFPLLVAAALVAARASTRQPAPLLPVAAEATDRSPKPLGQQ